MKLHINYAAGCYLVSQRTCGASALQNGFDKTMAYGLPDIEAAFLDVNRFTFSQPRGAGYWLWKPYVILKTLVTLDPGDWLMYTDSGMYFVRDPWPFILPHEARIGERGILAMGRTGLNSQYTKRDTFLLMGLDEPHYRDAPQITASMMVCRNTPLARNFIEEWLAYARDPRILTDLPNTQGLPNYPDFRDHRHDQSILSLLAMKHDIAFVSGVTQWEMPDAPCVIHHRSRE
jgi:hypothetical protein